MAQGNFAGGSGIVSNPFLIEDAHDLNKVRDSVSSHYRLVKNINLNTHPFSEGWTPIDDFTGSIDGAGHIIYNLKINLPEENEVGLFAKFSGSAKDLGISRADVKGKNIVGMLAGRANSNSIKLERCFVKGKASAGEFLGGFFGAINNFNNCEIINCYSDCELTIGTEYAGGLVGFTRSTLATQTNKFQTCYSSSKIIGGNNVSAGPLFGIAEHSTFTGCFYDKDRTDKSNVGVTTYSTFQMQDRTTMQGLRNHLALGRHVWKLLDNQYPKLWFEGKGKSFIKYDSNYWTFENGDWSSLGSAFPSLEDVLEEGLNSFDSIPIEKMRELTGHGEIEIYNVLEGEQESFRQFVEVLFDQEREDIGISVSSVKELPVFGDEEFLINPNKKCDLSYETEQEENSFALELITEEEKIVSGKLKESFVTFDKEKTSKEEKEMTFDYLIIRRDDNSDIYMPRRKRTDTEYDTERLNEEFVTRISSEQEKEVSKLSERTEGPKEQSLFASVDSCIDSEDEKVMVFDYLVTRKDSSDGNYMNRDKRGNIEYDEELETNSLKIKALTEKEKAVDSISNRGETINSVEVAITKDTAVENGNKKAYVAYEKYQHLIKERQAKVNVESEARSRYMISINNGMNWLTKLNGKWIQRLLKDIDTVGLTMEQMNDIATWEDLETDYRSKIKYAIGLTNENLNTTHSIKGVQIEFEPNKGPEIQDSNLLLEEDSVMISGRLYDVENDSIEYRVLTREMNEENWRQLTPSTPGWFKKGNGSTIAHTYNLSQLRTGENLIKIQTRDERGAMNEKELYVFLHTGEPSIRIDSYNEFYLNATMNHSLGKNIKFRIFINEKQVTPKEGFTDYFSSPHKLEYSWDSSDLLHNLPNEIRVEVMDEFSTKDEIRFHVIGGYRSLLFKDENNFYYSTDKGEILQQLDFGTVIGGLLAEPARVYIENRTGLELENVNIWTPEPGEGEKVFLKISKTYDPFVPVENFTFSNTMEPGETREFFVRVESDIDQKSIERKVFNVFAKGDPVINS